jgi:putative membrane protein insertion efficiency factor
MAKIPSKVESRIKDALRRYQPLVEQAKSRDVGEVRAQPFTTPMPHWPIIQFIQIYQQIAPKRLRASCRFEPSCSNYMIGAIERYGCCTGLIRGIQRLCRCRHPNGGVDLP